MKHAAAIVLAALLLAAMPGCEDQPPFDYEPMPYVEGYLFVDRPIEGIVVAMSQSLAQPYDQGAAVVRDAEVVVAADGASYTLAFRPEGDGGSYFLPDTTVLVKPSTVYALTVRFPGGKTVTAETVTPERIAWTRPPADILQYPSDTVRLPTPDSLRISWTPGSTVEYIVRVRCLDTAAYGAYLTPPTAEANGRTNNLSMYETAERKTFYSTTRWGFLQATVTPTVWTAFRWYGRNAVAILSPDRCFIDWFKLTRWSGNPQYNRTYSNINGGTGVFGSASLVEKEVFLRKRVK